MTKYELAGTTTGPRLSRARVGGALRGRDNHRIVIDRLGGLIQLAVDQDFLVDDLDAVAGQADHPFDVVFGGVLGKDENRHVPSLGLPMGIQTLFVKGLRTPYAALLARR